MKPAKYAKYLFLTILVSILPGLSSSCADTDTSDAKIPANADANAQTEQTDFEDESYKIPDADFDGYVMRLVTISNEEWAIPELDVEEETGEPVNDAIYRRNRTAEDALNIIIQEFPGGIQSHDMLRKSVMANEDEYDLMFSHASSGGPISNLGYYVNLYDVRSLNLAHPYWDQGAIESFELMGKLYFTASDACLMTNDAIWVLYFNKKIIQEAQLENPYQLVRDGKWTADAMHKMAREAATDMDGDGIFTAADQWGIVSHPLCFIEFLNCMGEQLVKKDGNGYPFLIYPDERFIGAYKKTRELTSGESGVFLDITGNFKGKSADNDHASKAFMNDRALFCAEVLGWSRKFREMTADFGILPHPKYDENQPAYQNATANTVPIFAIPITNPNPERTGTFIDALTALSATTVTPAYYTISLEGKFTRDEDSIEMLDIIRTNRIYDLAVIYNWNNFFNDVINQGMSKSGDNPLTVFDKSGEKVKASIEKTMDVFNEVN
ncbi:MAG: hypothetical protein FWG34_09800 [Oscillospiraceae bacterium]|nr:hypothetical protein [Oscillospiraceae bacterium]